MTNRLSIVRSAYEELKISTTYVSVTHDYRYFVSYCDEREPDTYIGNKIVF